MEKKADSYKKVTEKPSVEEVDGQDEALEARRNQIDKKVANMAKEYGGRPKEKGLEPTRYDDWELKGRCVDF